jgi:hypothetical protein
MKGGLPSRNKEHEMRRRIDRDRCVGVSGVARAGLLLIALILGSAPALADSAWCGSMYGPDGGYVTCAYASREQCIVAANGVGGVCYENPANAVSARAAPTPPRPGRR